VLRILFVFHKNKGSYTGAKVKPPRLNGAKMGLYATRCPYRPNPVGLSLARIDRIEGLYRLILRNATVNILTKNRQHMFVLRVCECACAHWPMYLCVLAWQQSSAVQTCGAQFPAVTIWTLHYVLTRSSHGLAGSHICTSVLPSGFRRC
jgi:hypothetical protein